LGNLPVELNAAGRCDELFSGFSLEFDTFQWHHDSFDVPAGAVLLASSAACPHQAFRIGARAWGTQFHPEVTDTIIRDWCAWDKASAARVDVLVEEFAARKPEYQAAARRMLSNYLGVVDCVKKK
jgi:GMP synthase-like glutamine amidotransferase